MKGWRRRSPTLKREAVRSWLFEPGSLTNRCRRACGDFRVRLLSYAVAPALTLPLAQRVRVREVLLECDGRPVIFARTELPLRPLGRMGRWLSGLGERSLGSLLFACPRFVRGGIEIRRLDRRHALYRRAVAVSAEPAGRQLWARCSLHTLEKQTVLVTEVFLPAIANLQERK